MPTVDTGTEELLCDIKDRVALVTLNKPHKKNALGDILTPALRAVLPELEARDDVGCVMITGAGDAFCAGGDVSEMGGSGGSAAPKSTEERVADLVKKQETLTGRIYHLRKPTVAALPGAAAGAGLSIALACDIRIASEKAFVVTAFRNIGLSGDYGASWFLPRLIGLARAKTIMFNSPRLSANECCEIGLIDKVFPGTSFRDDAMDYALDIANGPTIALGKIKKNLQQGLEQPLEASFELEARNMFDPSGSEESREAIQAFKEKRQPNFHQ
jgi:enoyl-CoA hydratase/carnithine racemase